MKSVFAIFAILFLISASSAFLKENTLETLKTLNEEKAAEVLTQFTDKTTFNIEQVEMYLGLIANHEILKSTHQKIQVSDFAVKALEEITKIKSKSTTGQVKAILSCVKNDKVYRYHITDLTSQDQKSYKLQIEQWLLERAPH